MEGAETLVFLLTAVVLLAGAGLRTNVPYPVVLVVGGLVLGLLPGLPRTELDPDVVFFAFLPPLLYIGSYRASAYELRDNLRPIGLLSIGLVTVTVFGVAAAAHWIAGLAWAPAFVLGAILGPTDPVAATAITSRLGAPSRLQTILEGESLVNDGTGLTAYKIAVAAVGTAAASPLSIVGQFLLIAAGGIAIGLAAGWLLGRARQVVREPSIDVTLSVLTPFAAYIPAEALGVSGVLAVVAAGLYIGTRSLDLVDAGIRLRTVNFWDSAEFLLNGLLFLLVGLQVRTVVGAIENADWVGLTADALVISAVVAVIRLAWMFVVPGVFHFLAPFSRVQAPRSMAAERVVLGWSGMRGGVSLAAALAVPLVAHGRPFPDRELLVFLAYATVVLSLVIPSLTLGPIVERLGLGQGEARRKEDAEARKRLANAALERLGDLASDEEAPDRVIGRLRERYEARLQRLEARLEAEGEQDHDDDLASAARVQNEMLEAERAVLRQMQRERHFAAELLRDLERELDLEESRLRARARA